MRKRTPGEQAPDWPPGSSRRRLSSQGNTGADLQIRAITECCKPEQNRFLEGVSPIPDAFRALARDRSPVAGRRRLLSDRLLTIIAPLASHLPVISRCRRRRHSCGCTDNSSPGLPRAPASELTTRRTGTTRRLCDAVHGLEMTGKVMFTSSCSPGNSGVVMTVNKGKPVERWGRKATGLRDVL